MTYYTTLPDYTTFSLANLIATANLVSPIWREYRDAARVELGRRWESAEEDAYAEDAERVKAGAQRALAETLAGLSDEKLAEGIETAEAALSRASESASGTWKRWLDAAHAEKNVRRDAQFLAEFFTPESWIAE